MLIKLASSGNVAERSGYETGLFSRLKMSVRREE